MVFRDFTLKNATGFHMRPARVFVTAMAKYASDVTIRFAGKDINGKSMMNIMTVGMPCGADITVICSGADEAAMLSEAAAMIEDGFGEG